jgi:hypothetical protein
LLAPPRMPPYSPTGGSDPASDVPIGVNLAVRL